VCTHTKREGKEAERREKENKLRRRDEYAISEQ
jgi:hypothetical protein